MANNSKLLDLRRASDKAILRSSTIMMVDDEKINTEVIQIILEETGYLNFVTTDDPKLAVKIALEKLPDMLLLDINMPEVSGFDIMKAMSEDERLMHIPILVLTSATDAETKLKALELGAMEFLNKPVDASELELRVRNTLSAKAYQNQLAYFDGLTGLPNHSMFKNRLSRLLESLEGTEQGVSILYIGISRYKHLANTLGLSVGDQIIKEAAQRIEICLQKSEKIILNMSDNWRNVACVANDEFAIIISRDNQVSTAEHLASEIVTELSNNFIIDGEHISVSPLIGIAVFPEDGKDVETLSKNASTALHQLSGNNGEPIRFFSQELHKRAQRELLIENDLRKAINTKQLVLYYQPKVDLSTGLIKGSEALLRWTHPQKGMISPAEFIPIAENSDLIYPIGERVLMEACAQNQAWNDELGLNLNISVNVSARQFQRGNLSNVLNDALKNSRMDAGLLTVELTETSLMKQAEENIVLLKKIEKLGVSISIDDFGTGYSSLSYLKRFPLNELKIDYTFTRGVDTNKDDAAIVNAIIAMAHGLELRVVVEGVETIEQLRFVQDRKCQLAQGYLFSKPVSAEEFYKLLKAENVFQKFMQ